MMTWIGVFLIGFAVGWFGCMVVNGIPFFQFVHVQ